MLFVFAKAFFEKKKLKNSLLATVVAPFTAKPANLEKTIYFLSLCFFFNKWTKASHVIHMSKFYVFRFYDFTKHALLPLKPPAPFSLQLFSWKINTSFWDHFSYRFMKNIWTKSIRNVTLLYVICKVNSNYCKPTEFYLQRFSKIFKCTAPKYRSIDTLAL